MKGQFVLVGKEHTRLCGFACLFANYDEHVGALLDNLHVRLEQQGRGLGKELMSRSGAWLQENYPKSGLYLWVFASNEPARRFYEWLGGQMGGEKMTEKFAEKPVRALRYVWHDVERLKR